MFANRTEAGQRLATALARYKGNPDAIVLGIPRGGVIVAMEVARALGLPLDVAIAAKVGAPGNPEYAIGAVAADGEVSANPSAGYGIDEVRKLSGAALAKVHSQMSMLREGRPPLDLKGRTAILVDDGLATGLTASVAADWARREGAASVVVAIPVAPPETVRAMRAHADDVIALDTPDWFSAVGQFYREFGQTEDSEVRTALQG